MELETQARKLAQALDLNLDAEVYRASRRDPYYPLLYGGNTKSAVGFFGRDPGKDEIRVGEPLIGAAGKRVRAGLFRHLHGRTPGSPKDFQSTSVEAFYANTVPYKQVANKSWGPRITLEFHPVISGVLVDHWKGKNLITLGNEAFLWFRIHQSPAVRAALETHWKLEDRYEKSITVTLKSPTTGRSKTVKLHPLPHPSPLNQTWYSKFPALMESRLQEILS